MISRSLKSLFKRNSSQNCVRPHKCKLFQSSRYSVITQAYAEDSRDSGALDHAALADQFNRDGFVVLRNFLDKDLLREWSASFDPLLQKYRTLLKERNASTGRGPERYYITLPFKKPFNDPSIYEHPDLLKILELILGKDFVMCQLATDTPLKGSIYQDIHRDTAPLFPDWGIETPSYQLAFNFPLCDVTDENGPTEMVVGTHRMSREEGLKLKEENPNLVVNNYMNLGDATLRDVRGLHRGTPNLSDVSRPMVVIGYSIKWLKRPEVSIKVPEHAQLSKVGEKLLRFEPRVSDEEIDNFDLEDYIEFAYDDKGEQVNANYEKN